MINFLIKMLTKITAFLIGNRACEKNAPQNREGAKLKYSNMNEFCNSEFFTDLGNKPTEFFLVAYRSPDDTIILDNQIIMCGDEAKTLMPDYRLVAKRCQSYGLSQVILVHNHPDAYEKSDVGPSVGDVVSTEQYSKLLKKTNITIYDHLIVGQIGVFSFRENHLL